MSQLEITLFITAIWIAGFLLLFETIMTLREATQLKFLVWIMAFFSNLALIAFLKLSYDNALQLPINEGYLSLVKVLNSLELVLLFLFISLLSDYKSVFMHLVIRFFIPFSFAFLLPIAVSEFVFVRSNESVLNVGVFVLNVNHTVAVLLSLTNTFILLFNFYLIRKFILVVKPNLKESNQYSVIYALVTTLLFVIKPIIIVLVILFPAPAMEITLLDSVITTNLLFVSLLLIPMTLFQFTDNIKRFMDFGIFGWGVFRVDKLNISQLQSNSSFQEHYQISRKDLLAFEVSFITAIGNTLKNSLEENQFRDLGVFSLPFPNNNNLQVVFMPVKLPDKQGNLVNVFFYFVFPQTIPIKLTHQMKSLDYVHKYVSIYEQLEDTPLENYTLAKILSPLV